MKQADIHLSFLYDLLLIKIILVEELRSSKTGQTIHARTFRKIYKVPPNPETKCYKDNNRTTNRAL